MTPPFNCCSSRNVGILPDGTASSSFSLHLIHQQTQIKTCSKLSISMATTLVQATIILCQDRRKSLLTALPTSILVSFQITPQSSHILKIWIQSRHPSIDFLLYLQRNLGIGMICLSLHLQSHPGPLPPGHKAQPSCIKFSCSRFPFRDPHLGEDFSYQLNRLHFCFIATHSYFS